MRNQVSISTLLAETFGWNNKAKSYHRAYRNSFFSNLFKSLSDPSLKRCLHKNGASSWLTAPPMLSFLDIVRPLRISRIILHVVPPLLLIMLSIANGADFRLLVITNWGILPQCYWLKPVPMFLLNLHYNLSVGSNCHTNTDDNARVDISASIIWLSSDRDPLLTSDLP